MSSRTVSRAASPVVLALLMVGALAVPALAAGGDLDPSFGNGGIATTVLRRGGVVADEAITRSGRIVVAGDFDSRRAFVARYLPDGHLDTTFGGTGLVPFRFPGREVTDANAVVSLRSNRIVVGGWTGAAAGGHSSLALTRFLPDGTLDPSFGTGGRVTTGFHSRSSSIADLAVAPGGDIVAAGSIDPNSDGRQPGTYVVARYRPDGRLAHAFGRGGVTRFTPGGIGPAPSSVAVNAQGQIVVAGITGDLRQDCVQRALVMRLTRTGTLDRSFANRGIRRIRALGDIPRVGGALLTPAGDIVVVGINVTPGMDCGGPFDTSRGFLARLLPNGALDSTFGGGDGVVWAHQVSPCGTNDGYGLVTAFSDAALQADQKVVVTGSLCDAAGLGILVARFMTDGTEDSTFGDGGYVTTHLDRPADGAALVLDSAGRAVVAGDKYGTAPHYRMRMIVARYLAS